MATVALDGTTLHYETTGVGPAVLLVHGFGLDARMWDEQVSVLGEQATVVRYDARGFGRSARDRGVTYTHADDGWALLDHLGVHRAIVVGLSMGGRIALQMALLAPARVRALVVLDAVVDGVPWDPVSQQGMAAIDEARRSGGLAAARSAWLDHGLFVPASADPELAARLRCMVEDYSGVHWTEPDPHGPAPDVINHLTEISAPTTVVVGELDVPCFQAMADVLATNIPHASKVVIAASGHMVNMESPAATNELLLDVIRASGDR
jgi:3-oxoadipate enol-lactonase